MAPLPFHFMIITDGQGDAMGRIGRALSVPVPVAVQLRDKGRAQLELRGLARELRELTYARRVPLLINSYLELALEVEADGVHLPARGPSIATARASLPATALIGVSCHALEELSSAAAMGAHYALLSPVHAVPGKAPPLGIDRFGSMARSTDLPVLALGGIEARDIAALRRAGASGIAVLRAVLGSSDPARALLELSKQWDDAGGASISSVAPRGARG